MHEVIGISESAARLLNQARLGFGEDGIAVVCSRIRDYRAIMGPLSKAARKGDRGFLVFEDNDLAVEWCENRLVRELPEASATKRSLADSALFRGVPLALLEQVEAVTRSHVYAQGEQILSKGQEGDGRVFFIESGHVSILVPLQNGAHQRIASLGPGHGIRRDGPARPDDAQRLGLRGHRGPLPHPRGRATSAGSRTGAPLLKIAVLENLASDMARQTARSEPVDRRARLMRG